MNELDEVLESLRIILAMGGHDSSDAALDEVTDAAEAQLGKAAAEVARFANQLDDGTGFFNSSSEFGRQLAQHFDEARRTSTVMGLVDSLAVPEMMMIIEMALLHVHARVGPHALSRVPLRPEDGRALERIVKLATATPIEAEMPYDPEDEPDDA